MRRITPLGVIPLGVIVGLGCLLGFCVQPAGARWRPPQRLTWYWQLQGRIDNSHDVAAYDVDGFDTSAAEVRRLHASGKHVICYIDAGTWENWRPDAPRFPRAVLGRGDGWPGERWLDIRQAVVRRLLRARFLNQCAHKGFDAVEPDNIDGYQARTGFPITARQQLGFDRWIARTVHSFGLAVLQKNDPDQAGELEPYFDGELSEQCNQYSECSAYEVYLAAHKPVLDGEYSLPLSRFCAADTRAGITAARYDLALDGRLYQPCR